jgi:hypothetical protein
MGNKSSCCDHGKPIRRETRALKQRWTFHDGDYKQINDPFFIYSIRPTAIYSNAEDDSIDGFNIQLTQQHDWLVGQSGPRGSLCLPSEHTIRLKKEHEGKNFFNIQQAHSIGSNGIKLSCDFSFDGKTSNMLKCASQGDENTKIDSIGPSNFVSENAYFAKIVK